MAALVIEMPMLPPPECSQNYHGSVKGRISATRKWRETAYFCAVNVRNEYESNLEDYQAEHLPFTAARLQVEFVVPHTGYERDYDNAAAGLKPAIDAMVLAGILAGDRQSNYQYAGPFVWTPDKSRAPLTIIKVYSAQGVMAE